MNITDAAPRMLRDAARARQEKRRWRVAGPVCAIVAAGFVLWMLARMIGVV